MSPRVSIRPVHTRADLRRFVALPYRLHGRDPVWVPPLRASVRRMLSRSRNPFFERAEAEYFLAQRNGEVLGRVAAIHNRAHNEHHGEAVGFFGFFDSVNDDSVAKALLDTAGHWLETRGLTVIRGPASFSTNDECGLVIDGFEHPPTILTPHTPPYYVRLVERAGFVKARDLHLYQSHGRAVPERLARGGHILRRRQDITLRPIDMRRFPEEIACIKRIYHGAWARNWGFVPMSDAEVDQFAAELKPIVIPDLVVFAEREGQTMGFAAAIPDINAILRKNRSGRLLPGVLRLFRARGRITRARIMLLGLLPEYRRTGADALMCRRIWERALARGFRWGEAGWVLENNAAMLNVLVRLGFERYKTLRLYERAMNPVGPGPGH